MICQVYLVGARDPHPSYEIILDRLTEGIMPSAVPNQFRGQLNVQIQTL